MKYVGKHRNFGDDYLGSGTNSRKLLKIQNSITELLVEMNGIKSKSIIYNLKFLSWGFVSVKTKKSENKFIMNKKIKKIIIITGIF